MSSKQSTIPLRIRYLAILLGMAFFFWLPFEDTSETIALILASLFSAWIAIVFLAKPKKLFQVATLNNIFAGILAGIAVTPITLVLMVIKTGLHGHTTPDFTNQQIVSVIERTPIWVLGGFLIGLGFGLWLTNHQIDSQSPES